MISLSSSIEELKNVLRMFDMKDCKSRLTLMKKGLHLKKGDVNKQPYRELIGFDISHSCYET